MVPPLKPALTTLQAFQAVSADLAAGQQIDYSIKPTESRKYHIETKGASDTLLVLFEDINGEPRFLAGDDDSGEDRNANIAYKLFKGRSYIVRLRLTTRASRARPRSCIRSPGFESYTRAGRLAPWRC